jgi:hypothetical protein
LNRCRGDAREEEDRKGSKGGERKESEVKQIQREADMSIKDGAKEEGTQ